MRSHKKLEENATSPPGDVAVLVSGGLDSASLAVVLLDEFTRVFPIHVRFGLRWEEAERTHLLAFLNEAREGRPGLMPLTVLDEPIAEIYGEHWSTAGGPGVPDARSEDEAVYLPGRNVLLAAKAAVWCRLRGVKALAFGTLKGNPFPDSTPGFFGELEGVLNRAMDGELTILRPFERWTKAEVLRRAAGLPLERTFSCLDPVDGGHCGQCNKCEERRNAFQALGLTDRTAYAAPPEPSTTRRRDASPCTE